MRVLFGPGRMWVAPTELAVFSDDNQIVPALVGFEVDDALVLQLFSTALREGQIFAFTLIQPVEAETKQSISKTSRPGSVVCCVEAHKDWRVALLAQAP